MWIVDFFDHATEFDLPYCTHDTETEELHVWIVDKIRRIEILCGYIAETYGNESAVDPMLDVITTF